MVFLASQVLLALFLASLVLLAASQAPLVLLFLASQVRLLAVCLVLLQVLCLPFQVLRPQLLLLVSNPES